MGDYSKQKVFYFALLNGVFNKPVPYCTVNVTARRRALSANGLTTSNLKRRYC